MLLLGSVRTEKVSHDLLPDIYKTWTTPVDPVHELPLWTKPYFVKLQAEKSLDEREKLSSHLSGQFKQEPMTRSEQLPY